MVMSNDGLIGRQNRESNVEIEIDISKTKDDWVEERID